MRVIRLIHRWTGLIIGLFFFISCLSGLLIVVGKIIGSYAPIFKFATRLHLTLFLNKAGHDIIGIATLLALVEIVTGYWIWGKMTASWVKSMRKKGQSGLAAVGKVIGFRFPNPISGLHNGAGLWGGLPLLIMILTGLTWSFGWYSEIVYALFDTGASGSQNNNLFHTLHALHVGSWEGLFSRLLWAAATLAGATLPVTGLMIYLRRRPHMRTGKRD